MMGDGVTLGASLLVPPRSAGFFEKRIFEKRTLPGIPCLRVAIPTRASAETWHAKPLKREILRFKSFRKNILARSGQGSSIVTPYSSKI
jgi:hypothetical protein